MPIEQLLSAGLLDPISADQPSGINLRWLPEWDRIREARQSDDGLAAGKWLKRDAKLADWRLVHELSAAMLRTRSKDLQLGMWLTEAGTKLHGFGGLRDGLIVVRELMVRFWDAGLYPVMEEGPEDRIGPFEWFNDKVADSVLSIPITFSSAKDRNYSLLDLRDARLVGSLAQCKDEIGDESGPKKRQYERALAEGRTSLEMFESAVKESRRDSYEQLSSDLDAAAEEFKLLEVVTGEKFGDFAPNLSAVRSVLGETRQEVTTILERKRRDEPNPFAAIQADSTSDASPSSDSITVRFPLLSPAPQRGTTDCWADAERLLRSGEVDAALVEMTRLAAGETSGRSRFERKLLLAEVCLATRRERLARAVLEELAEQIEKHELETWESSELISAVWTRLYEVLKRGGGADSEEAVKLYGRICRLDPWQALACSE